jgi:hypothetical protein
MNYYVDILFYFNPIRLLILQMHYMLVIFMVLLHSFLLYYLKLMMLVLLHFRLMADFVDFLFLKRDYQTYLLHHHYFHCCCYYCCFHHHRTYHQTYLHHLHLKLLDFHLNLKAVNLVEQYHLQYHQLFSSII